MRLICGGTWSHVVSYTLSSFSRSSLDSSEVQWISNGGQLKLFCIVQRTSVCSTERSACFIIFFDRYVNRIG